LDELRVTLELAERNRKTAETERREALEHVNELSDQVSAAYGIKRKLEADIIAMQSDLKESATLVKFAEERAKKAMMESSKALDEARSEQERAETHERARKVLENQLKALQIKLDEAAPHSFKSSTKSVSKLEQRVRELESELDSEQRRHAETQKSSKDSERRMKELIFQVEDDKREHNKMLDLIEKLQNKIKFYKHQVEEAEKLAEMKLSKYRTMERELEDADNSADYSLRLRAKTPSASSMTRSVSVYHSGSRGISLSRLN
jgi:myosin heavy chain 6/7